ncbi:DUF5680 domain-containing protein [Rahnella perminowiae]|uniref:DUF5680 domain-containing protein n=1 Tax=Rahnella perminowiae TaxID=2816244 RepID=UPI001EE63643|nr:DUF5680 domain-containing protein [Rahnella perminowiae]
MKDFLIEANRFLYTAPDTLIIRKSPQNDVNLIEYSRDNYSYRNYFTEGKIVFGQIIISLNNNPIWCMQFNGGATIPSLDERTMRNLRFIARKNRGQADHRYPIRGPRESIYADLHYFNDVFGCLDKFQGHEFIQSQGETCFKMKFCGGSLC